MTFREYKLLIKIYRYFKKHYRRTRHFPDGLLLPPSVTGKTAKKKWKNNRRFVSLREYGYIFDSYNPPDIEYHQVIITAEGFKMISGYKYLVDKVRAFFAKAWWIFVSAGAGLLLTWILNNL